METIMLNKSFFNGNVEGFPHKKARPMQLSAIKKIMECWNKGYKYVFLEAPTGFGKSAVAISLCKQYKRSFILVSTKFLQGQYLDATEYGCITVKGRVNFPCILTENVRCNKGACKIGRHCVHKPIRDQEQIPVNSIPIADIPNGQLWFPPGNDLCKYWIQKCDAIKHKHPVLNYQYFLNENAYVHDFTKRDVMICDEAHAIEQELMTFIEFSISDKDLKLINCKIPEEEKTISEWAEYISDWRDGMVEELKIVRKNALDIKDSIGRGKKIEKMEEMEKKIEKCDFTSKEIKEDPGNWVYEIDESKGKRKITFRPIFIRKWAKRLFSEADNILLQSATIIDSDKMAESLGLQLNECIYLKADSEFDVDKRPIFFNPVGKMSYAHKDKSLPVLIEEIKKIMEEHSDEKGVIHTHTYKIQESILNSIDSDRFVANRSGDGFEKENLIRSFMKSKKPLILVTPSATEGMDFKDDLCRWQIICKIPYPHLGSIQIKARNEIDRKWYQWKTVVKLVQTYGRGVRSKNDWCHTYILDSSFKTLYSRSRNMFPSWFTDAIRDKK